MPKVGKMLNEVLKNLFRKEATINYPFEKREMPERFRGKIVFDASKCVGCKLCMKDCPAGAITIEKIGDKQFEAKIDLDRCIYCGQCVDTCNKKAVSITGLENSTLQLVAGFITVAVFIVIRQGIVIPVTSESIFPILLLGVVNIGIGCYLYFSSIQQLPAQSVAICGYLEPLSALVFSAAVLQERLTFVQMVGSVLMLGGAAFGECFREKGNRI
jgi:ferredoxin